MATSSVLIKLFSCVTLAALAGCGGGASEAAAPTVVAASMGPVADCEAQACRALRIIDANAETYRADAARRAELTQAVEAM